MGKWRMRFLTFVGAHDSSFADFLNENERKEITTDGVDLIPEQEKQSAILQGRLISLTTKQAFAIVEPTQGNPCEAWRLLSQRYDPMTDARFASLAINIVGHKMAKNTDIQAALLQWEALLLMLEQDHREILSRKIRRAPFLNMFPVAVQARLYEHFDRLTTYEKVREEIVSLVQVSRGRRAMAGRKPVARRRARRRDGRQCSLGWMLPLWRYRAYVKRVSYAER